MAGRIRQEDIRALQERTDIVQVVSGYLQLRKSGRDAFVGLCPFHAEKTPSFSVSAAKQVYYCFGCGEGGDVFRFLQKVENLSFVEAVEQLARQAGFTLRYEAESATERRAHSRRQVLQRANAEAVALYHRMLLEGREGADARAYLQGRGLPLESLERFQVGYAPGYPDFLLRRMAKSVGPDLLVDAGLVARDASGTLRDRFRGRITFPIHDLSGNAVGIGGRLLAPSDRPAPQVAKYVNSPDTDIYHKSSLLYNLHRAKADIARTGRAFVVEGYTDVIALDAAGVPGVVATCGTALGEDHLRLLSRFAERAVLTFDADEAGLRAAERAFQFHEVFAVDLLVLVLPDGQDPADFVLEGSRRGEAGSVADRFLELADRAVPLVRYMIERAMAGRRPTDVEERARAVRVGLEYVLRLDDPVRRQQYAAVVADLAGASPGSVMLELQQAESRRGGPGERPSRAGGSPVPAPRSATPARESVEHRVEHEALRLAVQVPELVRDRLGRTSAESFTKASYRRVFEALAAAGTEPSAGETAGALVGRIGAESGDQAGRLVAALAIEPLETDVPATSGYVEAVFRRLEEFALSRRIDEVKRRLERLNPQREAAEYGPLFEEFAALVGARRRLREAAGEAGGEPTAGP